jgi:hypothetical protein
MFVAVPPGRDEHPVRVFPTFPEDLNQLADWLVPCGVTTVAMESTGVGLDSALGDPRAAENPPRFGQRATQEECAGAAHGLARMPVVTIPALSGIASSRVSA